MSDPKIESIIADSRDRIRAGDYEQLIQAESVDESNVKPGDVVYCPTEQSAYILEVAATNEIFISGLLTSLGETVTCKDDEGQAVEEPLEALEDIAVSIYSDFRGLTIGRQAFVIPSDESGIPPFHTSPVIKGLQIISLKKIE